MTTTCFLQASVVSTPHRFPPSITSPVLIHNHQFSSSNLIFSSYFTSSCRRNYQHFFVSCHGDTLTKTCDYAAAASSSEVVSNNEGDVNLEDEIEEMRILRLFNSVKKGLEKFIAESDPKVPLSAELNNDTNLIQMFEQRDPGNEISGKLHPKTMEANTRFKFHLNSSNLVIMAALTVGVTVLLLDEKAMALGPEGPLMEEFWENMRRYALYALTVSTGVAYAVFQPLYELLRNPISAIIVITFAVGSFYLVSQVLSAMVGVSDFNYEYSY